MKKLFLILSVVCFSFNVFANEESDSTVLVLENPQVDSLELVIDSLKTQFTKPAIFSNCRKYFFTGTFDERNRFIERLRKFKDSTFVVNCFENMIVIKEKEKELYNLIRNSTEDYSVRGLVWLHIKKTEAQILTLNDLVMKYTRNEFKIQRMELQRLVFE